MKTRVNSWNHVEKKISDLLGKKFVK